MSDVVERLEELIVKRNPWALALHGIEGVEPPTRRSGNCCKTQR